MTDHREQGHDAAQLEAQTELFDRKLLAHYRERCRALEEERRRLVAVIDSSDTLIRMYERELERARSDRGEARVEAERLRYVLDMVAEALGGMPEAERDSWIAFTRRIGELRHKQGEGES